VSSLGRHLAALAILAAASIAAGAPADDGPPPKPAAPAGDLEALGETLKAAVLSGTLSEEDAIRIWMTMQRALDADDEKIPAEGKDAKEDAGGPSAAKLDLLRLAAPRPGRVTTLLRPEFLRRDLAVLHRELDLDREQRAIVELLLTDYLESYELVSAPFREALGRARRARAVERIATALERANVPDTRIAIANTRDALRELDAEADRDGDDEAAADGAAERDAKRAARRAWARRMVVVTADMEVRLEALRERVERRRAEMEQAGGTVTADDLVRMARELRAERARRREAFIESLALVVLVEPDDAQRTRLETAVARVRIGHDLGRGRLGGETTNPWTALAETRRDGRTRLGCADDLLAAEMLLAERAPGLAATLDARTAATLDRELRGLEYEASRDRHADESGDHGGETDALLRPFAAAARREVAASVAVRDALLALLDESAAVVAAACPDTEVATVYRDAALRRGFRAEMRLRWAERAVAAAFRLEDLDGEARTALVAIERDVATTLRAIRAEAVAERVRRDPERAREQIEVGLDAEKPSWATLDFEEFLGARRDSSEALDERTEAGLAAILTAEQLARVPSRPPTGKGKWSEAAR
jgi:hypothetical protein